jgi:diamine N-acetyltransferase
LRAICDNEQVVGVLLVECGSETPRLVRFLVDKAHQRKGIGSRAVAPLATELAEARWTSLQTSFVPVEGGSETFWERCGFESTGRTRDDEPVWNIELENYSSSIGQPLEAISV